MKENPTWLPVVALALLGEDGRMLLHRRPEGKAHAGLWEFPGGKVEHGETPEDALIREISEELGIVLEASSVRPACFAESRPGEDARPIVILLYIASRWHGDPVALEGGHCAWFTLDDAAALPKPPLDCRLLSGLDKLLAR